MGVERLSSFAELNLNNRRCMTYRLCPVVRGQDQFHFQSLNQPTASGFAACS